MNREELEKKAKELKISFDEETSDEDLNDLIEEEEKRIEEENNSNDVEYLRAELKKVIKQRDVSKADKRKLKEKVDTLESELKNMPKSESFNKLKEELDALKEFKTEIDKKREEEELKNKTELERAELNFKKEMDALKKSFEDELSTTKKTLEEKDTILSEKDKKISKLRTATLKADVMEYANKFKAIKPTQIFKLLKDDFVYDDDLGKYVYKVVDDRGKLKDELTVEERVKEFLEDEDNDNLVTAEVKPGTQHPTTPSSKTPKDYGDYDPKDPKLIEEAENKGLLVEDLIEINQVRDKALGKSGKKEEE